MKLTILKKILRRRIYSWCRPVSPGPIYSLAAIFLWLSLSGHGMTALVQARCARSQPRSRRSWNTRMSCRAQSLPRLVQACRPAQRHARRSGLPRAVHYSHRNHFERFRAFLEIFSRCEFEFDHRGNYFKKNFFFLCVRSSFIHNVTLHYTCVAYVHTCANVSRQMKTTTPPRQTDTLFESSVCASF